MEGRQARSVRSNVLGLFRPFENRILCGKILLEYLFD